MYGFDRLQKYLTRRDDGLVRRPEMFFGSVRYPALQLLNGAVLGIDANDTGEVLGALGLAIDQPIVFFVAERAKGFLIHIFGAVGKVTIQTVFVGQWLFSQLYIQFQTVQFSSSMGTHMCPGLNFFAASASLVGL